MRKPGYILRSVSSVALFGAWLMGCPVWDESGMDGVVPVADAGVDAGPTPTRCSADRDCTNGYCNTSTSTCVTSMRCTVSTNCRDGYYCDPRGVCVPGGCASNADCTSVGAGLVCDTTARQCVPGGRCTSNTDCASTPNTPVCLGGSCQPDTNRCQFDYQCTGSGQSCVDGQCVVGCTAQNAAMVCGAGQVCTNGRCGYPSSGTCEAGCPSGQLCVSGACLATCQEDSQCGNGLRCDYGVCRVDTRPRPFCTQDSQCNAGSVCFNGACRRTCPTPGTGNDGGCMSVDVQFNLCRPYSMNRNLCTSTLEQNPECARTADCMSGRECVNARCQ